MQNVISQIQDRPMERVLCAVDNGFYDTKLYFIINGKEHKFKFNSKYEKVDIDDDLNKNNTMKLCWDDNVYLVGEGASCDSLDDDKYNNELARICTYAALSKISNFVGYEFDLVVGYPLTTCANSKDMFVSYLKTVDFIGDLGGEFKRFKVNSVNVLPQGISALYGLNTQDYKDKVVGILDIEGKTINGIVVNNLNPVRMSMFTEDLGILILYNRLKMKLNSEGYNVADYQIPYILKGELPGVDMGEVKVIVDTVIQEHVNDIKSVMRRNKWPIESLSILVIGGGSIVLKDSLCKILPHMIEVDNPVFANVKGFYQVGRMYYGY
jgi:plasmid segregation protein ParM